MGKILKCTSNEIKPDKQDETNVSFFNPKLKLNKVIKQKCIIKVF